MIDKIFQYDIDPVKIQRILIGFEAILEKKIMHTHIHIRTKLQYRDEHKSCLITDITDKTAHCMAITSIAACII